MQGLTLGDLSLPVLVALAALVVAELSLRIVALVQLVRTPAERVTFGGRKWAWALIIGLVNTVGWILWFVLGRKPVAADQTSSVSAPRIEAAADLLYPEPPQGTEGAPPVQPPATEPSAAIWDDGRQVPDESGGEPQ